MNSARMLNEEQIVLRFPEEYVRELDSNAKIELCPVQREDEEPFRYYEVKINNLETIGILLDLPCIIESHKTLDYINYFKSCDICQMLYIIPSDERSTYRQKSNPHSESSLSRMLIKGEKYKAKSGLTPGTYNITSRFFRREIQENPEEVRKVESLIKNIMENGTTKIVEEELMEISEGEEVPMAYEETYYPSFYIDQTQK